VWLFDEELFVGHSTSSLDPNRTFRNLYVNPLVEMIDRQNLRNKFSNGETRNGVFDEDPDQTLVLLVDFKTSGREVWPHVREQIGALRDRGYLTYFNGTHVINGPVTVVGTGNTPFDLVTFNTTHRDIFFDAPLDHLHSTPRTPQHHLIQHLLPRDPAPPGQGLTGLSPISEPFASNNSYYASVNFRSSIGFLWRGSLSQTQISKIADQVQAAHDRGLKARYWNTPGWPKHIRNHVWRELYMQGADSLNVDDLRDAARTDWMGRGGAK